MSQGSNPLEKRGSLRILDESIEEESPKDLKTKKTKRDSGSNRVSQRVAREKRQAKIDEFIRAQAQVKICIND